MNALIFASQEREGFLPAAGAFRQYLRQEGYQVNQISFEVNTLEDSSERDSVRTQIGNFQNNYDLVAYFGHGGSHSLISSDMTVRQFCDIFRGRINRGAKIILYACSTGTPGGFAEQISRQFADSTVYAHTTAEDATRNPAVVVYPELHPVANQNYIVHPNSYLWPFWVRKILESGVGRMYWREYPFQNIEVIGKELFEYAIQNHSLIEEEAAAYLADERSAEGAARLGRRYAQVTSRALRMVGGITNFEARRGESARAQRARRRVEDEANRVAMAETRMETVTAITTLLGRIDSLSSIDDILKLMRFRR